GQTIVVDVRYIDGRRERILPLIAELIRLDVSVIVAHATPASLAAKQATSSIPIVMFEVSDPVGTGLVASLAKPGGNLTGVAQLVATEIYGKQLQMLKDVLPTLSRVAVLWNPANPAQEPVVRQTEITAKALGITVLPLGVADPNELQKAIAAASRDRAGALIVSREALFAIHIERIIELTAAYRLPTMCGDRFNVEAGGVIGYGPEPNEISRRAAPEGRCHRDVSAPLHASSQRRHVHDPDRLRQRRRSRKPRTGRHPGAIRGQCHRVPDSSPR